MEQANPTAQVTSAAFGGAAELLKYGPLGLAGIFLVGCLLVLILSVTLKRPIEEGHAGVLRWFLGTGTFCFALALLVAAFPAYIGAAHNVTLHLEPSFADNELPAPTVQVQNGVLIPYGKPFPVAAELTVIIDLNKALAKIRELASSEARARQGEGNAKLVLAKSASLFTQQQDQIDAALMKAGEVKQYLPSWNQATTAANVGALQTKLEGAAGAKAAWIGSLSQSERATLVDALKTDNILACKDIFGVC